MADGRSFPIARALGVNGSQSLTEQAMLESLRY